jgi:FtsH-binding integral membrane protein
VIMKSSDLTDTSAFTASVLGIVGGQLGFTALASSIMAQPGPVHDLALTSPSLWPVFLVSLMTLKAALETESLVWLCAFTAAESWIVGLIVMQYVDAGLGNLIGQAAILTATDVLVLSAYVLSVKDNFNFLGAGLRVSLWSLLAAQAVELLSIYSPFGLVVQTVPMQSLTLGVVGSVVFSLYLVYDLSMTRTEYAEDNRLVAASVAIYLDIINLFVDFLRILGYFETESED